MLEATALSKSYNGSVALHPLDLRIEPGEIFCLLGANGAGKTTRFIPPASGTAKIGGLDVRRTAVRVQALACVHPEQVMLYKNLTGIENLERFRKRRGHDFVTHAAALEEGLARLPRGAGEFREALRRASAAAAIAPAFFIRHGVQPEVYFKAVVMILAFVLARVAMALSSVSVVGDSVRLRR